MRTRHLLSVAASVAALTLFGAAAPAAAQSQGPLVLLPSTDRNLIAPEVKITDINGTTGTLIGAYAGRELDRRLFLGGAGYWLMDPRDTTRLFYGGVVAGWQVVNSERGHLGVRALAGGGEATLYAAVPYAVPDFGWRHVGYGLSNPWVGWRDSFFVAEPELRAEFDLSDNVRIGIGAGYRVTSASGWFGDRLRGVTGSLSVQLGLGR